MIFLGQASNYSPSDIFYHTFAYGSEDHLDELRAFLAAHYGSTKDHVAVFHNGRSALTVAIKSVVSRGAKVIVNGSTCYAVIEAVRAAGCVPVYADINKENLHFGKEELKKALDGETNVQAVIVQNNLGIPCDIVGIEEVANKHKLAIIEDLAHSAGVKYKDGREAGTVGRAVVLSFGKGKSIDTISGGAVVLTNPLDTPIVQPDIKPALSDRLRDRWYPFFGAIIRTGFRLNKGFGKKIIAGLVKTHMIQRSADAKLDIGVRITYWQAHLALRQLKQLPRRGRAPIRKFYLVKNRDEVLQKLENNGIILSDIWYTTPVAPERYFESSDFHPEACPVAVEVASQIINLPTYYRASDLKPARKIISEYLIEKADLEAEEDPIIQLATALASDGEIPDLKAEIAEALENSNVTDRSQEIAEESSIEEAMNGKKTVKNTDLPDIDAGFKMFRKKIANKTEEIKSQRAQAKRRSLEQKLRDAEEALAATGEPQKRKSDALKIESIKEAPIPASITEPPILAEPPVPVLKLDTAPIPEPKQPSKPAQKTATKTFRAPEPEKPRPNKVSGGSMPGMRENKPKTISREEILKKQNKGGVR